MAGSTKSGIRWWMWTSIILGAVGSFVAVTILLRRRKGKEQVVPIRRIELKPKPSSSLGKTRQPAKSKPESAKPDDLKAIEGVGPKTADVLQSSGIGTYAQLASAGVDQIKVILGENGIRANPATWPEQARLAAAGKWEALETLQAELKGGRRA
jgi:predicted flap endonuclease-1-like 5' DNA nuclease